MLKKILITIFSFLGIFSLFLGLYCFIIILVTPKDEPKFFMNKGVAVVISESMLPEYKINDHLEIEKFNQKDELEINEVYIYKKDGLLIVHRLVDYDGQTCLFKGDNNDFIDVPTDKSTVVAKVVRKTNFTFNYVAFAGLLSLVGLGLSVVVIDIVKKKTD